jgi:phosphate-selective porin OprO/OprP
MKLDPTRRRRLLAVTALASGLLAASGAAHAQSEAVQTAPASGPEAPVDPREARIEALEAQIQALASEVQDLKASESAGFKAVRSDAGALPKVSFPNGRPTIASADGDFKVAIRTVVQFDGAHYDVDPLRTDNDLASGTNFRRARLGVDATVFRDWNVSLWGEFGGSGGEASVLNQAYVEYAGIRLPGVSDPLRVRAGAWATPAGLEDATSNTDSLFLERPAIAELVRSQATGDGRTGVGLFANGQQWYASAVLTGKVVGIPTTAEFDQQEGYAARLAFNPLHSAAYDLHIGANVQGVIKPADTTSGPLTTTAVRLRERPELRVDGSSTRLVDTGSLIADGLVAYGLEAGGSFKSLYVAGEWFKIDVQRTLVGAVASPFDPSFSGWYVQGAWTVTGEHRPWNAQSGGFRGIRPAKPFDLKKGGIGAFEIAGRYSVLDLNDQQGLPLVAAPFGGIRGGKQRITSIGVNWYPNSVVRFLVDYQWTNVDRLSSTGADIGEDVRALSFRSQFAF